MGDIKLFRIEQDGVSELQGQSLTLEKSLQTMLEKHLQELLGVRFLASEYSTGKTHGGRIDTLGIDENGCPVIIEYKRSTNENVINQGLFYLDWLMDHKAELELLVQRQLGQEKADQIEWSTPRLLCIAGDFTRYDQHAVQQINRNIELIRYRSYGDGLLMLELVNATQASEGAGASAGTPRASNGGTPQMYKTIEEVMEGAPESLRDVYAALEQMLFSLGDDVQKRTLKYYVAFKRIKNVACVEMRPRDHVLVIYVNVNPDAVALEEGFTRDVRNKGHIGTGDMEIRTHNLTDLERARPLLEKAYENS